MKHFKKVLENVTTYMLLKRLLKTYRWIDRKIRKPKLIHLSKEKKIKNIHYSSKTQARYNSNN